MNAPQQYPTNINPTLKEELEKRKVSADRVHPRTGTSDIYVMCETAQEAWLIRTAGPWQGVASVFQTNPEHPDARRYPWGVDIPFAALVTYMYNWK